MLFKMETVKVNRQLGGHLENPDGGKWYKCTECNFENGLASNYEYHMACHTRNQRIKCPLCSFSAKAKFYVARHLKLHHLNMPNIVPQHQFAYLEEMNYVIETLLEINENHQLGQSSIDVNHDSLSSSVNEEEEKESDDAPSSTFNYKCTLCNYSTDHSANVELHEKAHNQGEDQEFQCTLCNYSSNLKFVVIRHMNRDHQCPENQEHYLQAIKEKGIHAATFESMDIYHQENPSTKSNNESHLESGEMGIFYNRKFEMVDLCDDDEDEDEPKTEGTNTDNYESLDVSCNQDNLNVESNPENYLESKEMGPCFYTPKVEFVDLCDEDDDSPKENPIRIRPWANTANDEFNQPPPIGPIEDGELEIEETECRKRISQYREDIRKARFCMAEIRIKIKKQKRILSENVKQKEIKSRWLAMIRANNQKVADLSIEYKKLEALRIRIRETNKRKCEAAFHLNKLMNQQHHHLHNCTDCVRAGDKIVVDLVESGETDAMIEWLKSRISGMQNELDFLEREEQILARDVGLLYKCVDGIGPKVSDQKLQFLVLELEEIERKIQASLLDKTEDELTQLVSSTEEKVRNLFVLKNNLLDIMFLRKSFLRNT